MHIQKELLQGKPDVTTPHVVCFSIPCPVDSGSFKLFREVAMEDEGNKEVKEDS